MASAYTPDTKSESAQDHGRGISHQQDEALELETDDADLDSAYGESENASETTSLGSSLIRGHFENGRKYATLRDDYWGPSDEKQFEVMDTCHFLHLVLLSHQENMLFCSPVRNCKRVLDIGTGPGTWAVDVADKFPDTDVYGIDIFPPPTTWVPPNCFLEVDDVTKEWTWRDKFDLVHLRYLNGAFTPEEWAYVYSNAYNALTPGGWIEQIEPSCHIMCDDGTMGPESYLAKVGQTFQDCAEQAGRSINVLNEARKTIEDTGFVNVQESHFKLPIGPWARNERLKEAGRINLEAWTSGLEGFLMFLLTKFGKPEPWSKEEVLVYTAKLRAEMLNSKIHSYHFVRRVWAQKPLNGSQ